MPHVNKNLVKTTNIWTCSLILLTFSFFFFFREAPESTRCCLFLCKIIDLILASKCIYVTYWSLPVSCCGGWAGFRNLNKLIFSFHTCLPRSYFNQKDETPNSLTIGTVELWKWKTPARLRADTNICRNTFSVCKNDVQLHCISIIGKNSLDHGWAIIFFGGPH